MFCKCNLAANYAVGSYLQNAKKYEKDPAFLHETYGHWHL